MAGRHAARRSREGLVTESDQYAAAVARMLWALGRRISTDPGALAYVPEVEQVFRDAVNLGYALANEAGWSQSEMAAITGITQQAAAKRVKAGRAVRARIEAEAGTKLVRLDALRRARARRHADAGIEDRTAGRLERTVWDLREAR